MTLANLVRSPATLAPCPWRLGGPMSLAKTSAPGPLCLATDTRISASDDKDVGILVNQALQTRTELAQLSAQIRAQELALRAAKGNYGPSLGLSSSVTEAGIDTLTWNANVMVTLWWPLYQGGLTNAQTRGAAASVEGLKAQGRALRQQVFVEVQQARLAVRASKASLEASKATLGNARERLGLAEERYRTALGSAIELGDAQLAATNAAAQIVQADFNLLRALGQKE
jgi:outer membrane protein